MTKIYVKLHIGICDTNAYFGILLISKKKQNGMVNQCGHSYLHISYMSTIKKTAVTQSGW